MSPEQEVPMLSTKKEIDWRKISKGGILTAKFLVLLFILCLMAVATYQNLIKPYSFFVIGLEIALTLLCVFTIVRMNTYKPAKIYDFENLRGQTEPAKLLLVNINYDIGKYEEGSSFYFNGVRFYKYSTIILAGVSTIVLGLDLGDNASHVVIWNLKYTTFAKNLALIIGAIITVTTSLMTYWNIEKYWLTNKTIVNKLRALRDEVESDYVAKDLGPEKLKERIEEYRKIKGDFYKYWEGALADRGSQNGQGSSTGGSGR